ncbi:cell division protein FtsQ/DivIB [Tessaracoccus lacteus]|uniref:FtsQ-type POTRA domain-containing protein n=1 Tax=Tessaracoccus lacteus TaxID=3041766 RepID=A0ABY8Q0L8_9ACTN|nr:FtsQ-type POTRA domain-containing protein [Tessaracoccus sp. T21]WGT48061.1 FtsQ-type POTRA domain-containing protein [Tessaracoccus sp. T21]
MTQPLPPGVFAKALQERRVRQRRRRVIGWSVGGGLLLLVVALVYAGWFSPWLTAQRVEVHGTSLLTPDEVAQAAEVEMGVPLLSQDLAAVRGRVAALPEVRDVTVGTQFPETVVINVTERAVVYQRARDGGVDWVDSDGIVFRHTDDPTGVIQVETDTDDQRLLADVATVVLALPDDVSAKVRSFQADAVDQIEFHISGGRTVVWGSADESELKAQVLTALLTVDASVYDVSAPLHPTTK